MQQVQPATGQLWERRQERVTYETAVRLQLSGFDGAMEAQVTNLSLSGVFVSSEEFWDVGTELFCDLPLLQEHLRVRGRVVWVRPDHAPTGMGIEFVDLSGNHVEALSRLLETGPQEVSQLRIWFDGMAQPIRAEALPSIHGLQLRTALPFLRAGSVVCFATDGESQPRDAMLGRTSLYAHPDDPVPRLQVELHIDPEVMEPLEIAGESEAEEPIPAGKGKECSGTIENSEVSLPLEEVAGQSVEVSTSLRGQLLELKEEPYEAPEAPEPSHWTFDEETRRAVEQAAELADPLPGMDPIQEDREFWRASGEAPYRWLWLGAFSLLVVAVASASYTGLFSRVGDVFDAWFGNGGDKTSSERAFASSLELESVAPAKVWLPAPSKKASKEHGVEPPTLPKPSSEPVKAPLSAKPIVLEQVKEPPPAPEKSATKAAYQLSIVEGTTSLRIPLLGSIKGHQAYPLAKPDGLAVKLPHAKLRLPRGLHRVGRGGVRTLWLRRFEGGVQLRVLYEQPSPSCRHTIKSDAVELECRPAVP